MLDKIQQTFFKMQTVYRRGVFFFWFDTYLYCFNVLTLCMHYFYFYFITFLFQIVSLCFVFIFWVDDIQHMNQDSQSIKGQTVKILPPIAIPSFPVPFLYPRNILWSYNQIYTCTPSNAIPHFNTNFSFLYTVFHILVFSYNNRFWRSYQCIKNPVFIIPA